MAARSKARKRALDILFEAEQRGIATLRVLTERQSLGEHPVPEYAAELVRGIATRGAQIDELISWNLVDWTLDRMPAVDRNILRIGVYELLWAGDVPDGVAISEAVALAQDLSTDASPAFVNGVLSRLKSEKPRLSLDPTPSIDAAPPATGQDPLQSGDPQAEDLQSGDPQADSTPLPDA